MAKKLPVTKCDSARSDHSHQILIVLTHFSNKATIIPLSKLRADLVLQVYVVANFERGRGRVCSDTRSPCRMCLLRKAFSLAVRVQRHRIYLYGIYFPGLTRTRSRVGRPNRHWVGDRLVERSGVFLYCMIVRWKLLVTRGPFGPVLFVMIRFTVFTPTSVRQMLCGNP